jgi:L-threonylcarbamoyladenylate synthase
MWEQIECLKSFWPGPLSLILPKHPALPEIVSAGNPTVAVRIPSNPVALELISAAGRPIAAPSANRSNYVSPTTAQHVEAEFGDAVKIILDGGPCTQGIESTVLSLVHPIPTILRLGHVSLEQLQKQLGVVDTIATTPQEFSGNLSPGMLKKHYSPRTPLIFIDQCGLVLPKQRIGVIRFSSAPIELSFSPVVVRVLSATGDQLEIASALYAALRELDDASLDLILIDRCPRAGLGAAIMDRLDRAVTPT